MPRSLLALLAWAGYAVALVAQPPARTPDVHYTPTRHAVADAMLELAGVGPGDIVYDLGSGDGRIPIIAAQKYGARGVGIEIEPALVALARKNAVDAQVADRVTFQVGDLFSADLSRASVVTMYLSPNIMNRIEPGLRALKPGTRLVSHQFQMNRWPPDRRARIDEAEIFMWVVPPAVGVRHDYTEIAAVSATRPKNCVDSAAAGSDPKACGSSTNEPLAVDNAAFVPNRDRSHG